ncbi:type II secretion system F family protein [Sedimentisphaera salicampi]|uniref:General secretion pathway protein F n=1 Tax=Sedimentisphaera salicampi TaxID=1941349 RepID=A0A1W6LP75_9BACT|nr:type II secretion system F family protein [Sedimentisphaera salicampi]ARN57542.1 General secretion pathway protein F [Sedimentisphaera salicampi]OXU14404.1 General secretion pathway protein F [Sedimentisphaera salicampi]
MPLFEYKAFDSSGAAVSGRLEAAGRKAALDTLAAKGLMPSEIQQNDKQSASQRAGRVSKNDIETYTRELGSLLTSGMPLSRAVKVLENESDKPASKNLWKDVSENISNGASLADALSRWPKYFPPVYSAMVRAGEMGGFLDLVLNQIADFRSSENELRSRVQSAMIYPIILSVFCFAILVFLMLFFIPRFSSIFMEFGGELPGLTKTIVAASEFIMSYWYIILFAVFGGVVFFKNYISTPQGRARYEKTLLSIPIAGTITAKFAFVRFTRMLGTLIGAGVPLVDSLKVAREAIGNHVLSRAVSVAVEDVQKGSSLSASLRRCPELFSGANIEMISIAEESSRLDQELQRLAEMNEKQLDRKLKTAVSVCEPLMLFIMASIVGTIVVGMLLPIFNLQELIH